MDFTSLALWTFQPRATVESGAQLDFNSSYLEREKNDKFPSFCAFDMRAKSYSSRKTDLKSLLSLIERSSPSLSSSHPLTFVRCFDICQRILSLEHNSSFAVASSLFY
jgi:hypothetical protein